MGFVPMRISPVIYAEKGILTVAIEERGTKTSLQAGMPNVVSKMSCGV